MTYTKNQKLKYSAAMHSTPLFMHSFLGMIPANHQFEVGKLLDNDRYTNLGIFIARDHGKSAIASLSYPLRLICNNPDLRILIVQKTSDSAIKSLSVIKEHLEKNKVLRNWYAAHWYKQTGFTDIVNKSGITKEKLGLWQQRRIYVKRSIVSKDPSIETVGVGGAITGGRADIIILDDILDDENTRTESRLQSIKEWYEGTVNQLREPWTKTILIGTPKSNSEIDIYNIAQNSPSYKIFFMPAILEPTFDDIEYEVIKDSEGIVEDIEVKNPDKIKVLWKEKWDIKSLLFEYIASLDQAIWKREKLLDLTALAGTVFNRAHFNFYDEERIKLVLEHPETVVFATLDSAWETKASSDYSSLVIGALLNQKVYILDVTNEKLNLYDMLDLIVEKYMQWNFLELLIENAASGKALIQMIEKETHVPVAETSHEGKDKVARARVVTPYVQQGRVFIPEYADWKETFLNQVTQFPFSQYDDLTDSFVYLLRKLFVEYRDRGGIHV